MKKQSARDSWVKPQIFEISRAVDNTQVCVSGMTGDGPCNSGGSATNCNPGGTATNCNNGNSE